MVSLMAFSIYIGQFRVILSPIQISSDPDFEDSHLTQDVIQKTHNLRFFRFFKIYVLLRIN